MDDRGEQIPFALLKIPCVILDLVKVLFTLTLDESSNNLKI